MSGLAAGLYRLCISLWVGGAFVVGLLVVPAIFAMIPDRSTAGGLAGEIFSMMAWLGIACGSYLLVFLQVRWRAQTARPGIFWLVVAMLVIVLAGKFGIQPLLAQIKSDALPLAVMASEGAERFAFWHTVSSTLFATQSIMGLVLISWQERGLATR